MTTKIFDLHWMNGDTERIYGDSIEQAAQVAGIGRGALAALDYWEEKKTLPNNEKLLYIDNDTFCNPDFIEALRKADTSIGSIAEVKFGSRVFKYSLEKKTGTGLYFQSIKE